MAFRKTLMDRLLTISKSTTTKSDHSSLIQKILHRRSDSGGLFRRFLHQNLSVGTSSKPSPIPIPAGLPTGDELMERLRKLNGERIRLDTLSQPIPPDREGMTVEEARKVLKVSEMEAVKARLRGVNRSSISFSDFVRICREGSSRERGDEIARSLDESGAVLVLGDVVFLQPELVARAIESVIPTSLRIGTGTGTQTTIFHKKEEEEELKAMEEQKSLIDSKAEALVRRELWCGLGFFVAQTLGFMRLTFWELSWDVMEPICYYVTCIYFMAGYSFFLRTSKDPSFEGFFESRLASKQRKLIKNADFDLRRFNYLRQTLSRRTQLHRCSDYRSCSPPPLGLGIGLESNYCDCRAAALH